VLERSTGGVDDDRPHTILYTLRCSFGRVHGRVSAVADHGAKSCNG
jgi:hypothetical protein